MSDPI